MQALQHYLSPHTPQIIGLSETNLVWNRISVFDRLYERFRRWSPRIKTRASYIPYDSSTARANQAPHQYGGVASITLNDGCSRWHEDGTDTKGLGRWTWTKFRGSQGKVVRVVTAYRPNGPSPYPGSVFNQQKVKLLLRDDDRDPRIVFWEDLKSEAKTWIDQNELLVIGMDMNADVKVQENKRHLEQLGLLEILTDRHSQTPATFLHGTKTIDAIFVSKALRQVPCGYLPFKDGFDHRALWIDIPNIAFGSTSDTSPITDPHRLNDDPRVQLKFRQLQLSQRTKYSEQIEDFHNQAVLGILHTGQRKEELNRLYDTQILAMNEAEKGCRKLCMGNQDWTPEFRLLRARRICWKKILSKLRGSNTHTSTLARLLIKGQITHRLRDVTEEIALAELDKVKKECSSYRKSHQQKRIKFLEKQATRHAEVLNIHMEKVIQQKQQAERQRRNGRILRRISGKLKGMSFTSVYAPDDTAEWVECSTKEMIESACLEENERRFNQARTTPFLQSPLLEAVGKFGFGPHTQDILNGTYHDPNLDYWTNSFLQHLQRPTGFQQLQPGLCLDGYRTLWKRVKIKSASPYGPRFHHLKANSYQEQLSVDDFRLSDIAFRTGFSPQRWQRGMNVMLLKKPNEYKVTRLRTILLFDTAFNFNNKAMGRATLAHAEAMTKYNHPRSTIGGIQHLTAFPVAPEQYGSRKYHQAIEQGLNKRLIFDISRQLKAPLAMAMTDLKSCYDRMVLSVISLALQRVGAPPAAIQSMVSTLHDFEHHCRTPFGDSDAFFTGKRWQVPIQGIGQGNGAGPTTWAFVSTPVLNMLRSHECGAKFHTPMSKHPFHMAGFSFVDDTDLLSFFPQSDMTVQDIVDRMQLAVDGWRGGMWATGGALVPEKSHWYLVFYKWKNGNWRYAKEKEIEAELQMKDADGVNHNLTRHENDHAERTLGVRLAPDGNCRAEKAYLRKCSEEWESQIKTGVLPRNLTWQALLSTIMRKLQYPLLVTSFSEADIKYIMAPVLRVALSHSGICRTMHHAVVYGTHRYQGLNVPDLHVEQGLEKLACIVKYIGSTKSITAQLLSTLMENFRLETGGTSGRLYQALATRGTRQAILRFSTAYTIGDKPSTALPCTVEVTPTAILFQGSRPCQPRDMPTSRPTLIQYLRQHQDWGWLFSNTSISGNIDTFIDNFRTKQCIAVSDGSFKDGHGTAAWRLGTLIEGSPYIQGWSVTPGSIEAQGSYRSELHGTLASIVMVNLLREYLRISSAKVDVVCDNLTVIKVLQYEEQSINPKNFQNFDILIASLRHLHSDVTWTFTHVSGHVDSKFPNRILTTREQINVEMDLLAKQGWDGTHHAPGSLHHQNILREPWAVHLGKEKISKSFADSIRDWCQRPRILGYWIERQRLNQEHVQKVNFDAVLKAMKSSSVTRRHWVSKHASGTCGVNKWMKRWGQRDSDLCPRCDTAQETSEHVWHCRALESDNKWEKALSRLKTHMIHSQTDPILQHIIIQRLRSWQRNDPPLGSIPAPYRLAVEDQDCLGWQNFFMGFTAYRWIDIQRSHFRGIGSRKSPERWIAALIQKQWDIAWDIWEYRNQVVHDHELAATQESTKTNIRSEYDKGHQNIRSLKPLFRRSADTLLNTDLQHQLRWLKLVQTIREREIRKETTTPVARMRNFMDTYFQVAPT